MSPDVNSDMAYERIRKSILNGKYGPGQHLNARAIASELGVSATPVRDALRQLEADGLVTIYARQGARVNAMGVKEFRELCELRLVLETHMAGLAAQYRTEPELREMELALAKMRQITNRLVAGLNPDETGLLAQMARVDIQFHIAVMAAARNDLIRDEILRLHLVNRVIARAASAAGESGIADEADAAHLREVLTRHEAIFDAIRRRDIVAAKTAMEHSLQDIMEQTLRTMARHEHEELAREFTSDTAFARPLALIHPARTTGSGFTLFAEN